MDLLSGGVAIPRVIHLVKERGIDFEVSPRLEQAFLDSGGDQSLILALREHATVSIAARMSEASPVAPKVPAARSSMDPKKLSSPATEPAPSTSADVPAAQLQVRSRPADVAVFVDDELMGNTTPEDGHLNIGPLKPGKHRLRASRAGYEDVEATVELAPGQVLELPIWLAKTETPLALPPEAPSFPPGKKFLVRHTHRAYAGLGGGGYCQGWMVVDVGYVRYISTDSTHKYLLNTSEIREAKASSGQGNFRIKLDFGREYQFVAVDDKGKTVSAGPVLTEIRSSMGQ